jgi:carboxypeptidase C (cathepsin A)
VNDQETTGLILKADRPSRNVWVMAVLTASVVRCSSAHRSRLTTAIAVAALAATSSVGAQRGSAPARPVRTAAVPQPIESLEAGPVTTRHQITLGGRTLKYTARAGLLPIRINETGEPHGRMFFTAYLLDRQPADPPRPLTFLWNGGPGANSVLVHLMGFGPRRIKIADDPTGPPSCECELEDNQTTWLDRTDLIFVDPIGTGFSRPTRSEYGEEFYNTLGDIASMAEFVRVYLTRFDAGDAPLVIGGESYGVWRAAGVAEMLEQRGRRVAGVVFISGGMGLGTVGTEEMRTALFIPTRTAAAFFHRRLSADLQFDLQETLGQATSFASADYAPALARRDELSESERTRIVAQLARFTGLSPDQIDRQSLVVGRQQFAEQLLRDQERVLGRFDTRLTADREAGAPRGRAVLVAKYLRSVLQVKTDLAYQGLEDGFTPSSVRQRSVGSRWNYNQGPAGAPPPPPSSDAPPGGSQPWLRRAMTIDPALKAFVAAGLYDSLNSCAVNDYIVSTLEPEIARNITARCYQGGHMMYEDASSRRQLKNDIDAFFDGLSATSPRRTER